MLSEQKIRDFISNYNVNGTVCITRNGETLYSAAHGYADRENNIAYDRAMKTYIASCTKQFTAACVMLLHEEGKLNIDDRLSKYIPEYSHSNDVTLRQMLNMTSGIIHELDVIYNSVNEHKEALGMTERDFQIYRVKRCAPKYCKFIDFLALVDDKPLLFTPGEKYDYSDTNYMMLGEIVGRITGMDIGEYMNKRIFEPLGMTNTVFGAEKSDTVSYQVFEGVRENLGRAHFVTGEGAICTTAEDFCVWLNAVLRGDILTKESWDMCFTFVHDVYGFGWEKRGEWLCHGGGDLGYSSISFIHFPTQTAIAIALNEDADDFFFKFKEFIEEN